MCDLWMQEALYVTVKWGATWGDMRVAGKLNVPHDGSGGEVQCAFRRGLSACHTQRGKAFVTHDSMGQWVALCHTRIRTQVSVTLE